MIVNLVNISFDGNHNVVRSVEVDTTDRFEAMFKALDTVSAAESTTVFAELPAVSA